MQYFDFHTHLDFYKDEELDGVCEQIVENRIRTFSASVNIDSYIRNLEIKNLIIQKAIEKGCSEAESKKLVTITFGVHPSYTKNLPEKENEALNLLLPYYERTPFISEVGLDFFWEKDCPKEVQVMHLLIALDAANKKGKTVLLHTKGAEKEIFEMLQDFPRIRPVIHWYDGPAGIYKKFLEKGCLQTFGCELRYSNIIKDFLRMTPLELVLPETDNPTGEPWLGGSDSSPLLIKRIYSDIADEKSKSVEEISFILNDNLGRFYKENLTEE